MKQKKKLSLAQQAILDAKAIITSAQQTVKKELTQSISKNVSKKLSQNLYDDENEDQYVPTEQEQPVEQVDEFLDDYMTPETDQEQEQPVIQGQQQEQQEDQLLFDQTGQQDQPKMQEQQQPSTEEDQEQLNLDDIEQMVNKLRQQDQNVPEEDQEQITQSEQQQEQKQQQKIQQNAEQIGVKPVDSQTDTPMTVPADIIKQYQNKIKRLQKESNHYLKQLKTAAKVIVQQKKYIDSVSKALAQSKILTLKSNCISNITKRFNITQSNLKAIVTAFDKAKNNAQIKLVYEAINNTLKNSVSKNTKSINQNFSSNIKGSTKPSKSIVNERNRFQELANLI